MAGEYRWENGAAFQSKAVSRSRRVVDMLVPDRAHRARIVIVSLVLDEKLREIGRDSILSGSVRRINASAFAQRKNTYSTTAHVVLDYRNPYHNEVCETVRA